MSIPGIHHVQIAIPEGGEETARTFYHGLLSLEEIDKPDHLRPRGGVWFQTANLELHLGIDRGFVPATKAHVAFACSGLDHLRERLREAGYVVVDDEPLPGYARFYTNDPFGNRIELLEPEADSGSG